jgi:hypothetical protein
MRRRFLRWNRKAQAGCALAAWAAVLTSSLWFLSQIR